MDDCEQGVRPPRGAGFGDDMESKGKLLLVLIPTVSLTKSSYFVAPSQTASLHTKPDGDKLRRRVHLHLRRRMGQETSHRMARPVQVPSRSQWLLRGWEVRASSATGGVSARVPGGGHVPQQTDPKQTVEKGGGVRRRTEGTGVDGARALQER